MKKKAKKPYSTERVVKHINIAIGIDCAGQRHALLLPAAEIDTTLTNFGEVTYENINQR